MKVKKTCLWTVRWRGVWGRILLLVLLAWPLLSRAAQRADRIGTDQERSFELTELLKSDFFNWPETLLSYHVDFAAHETNVGAYRLVERGAATSMPLQWSDVVRDASGSWKSATLSFTASLKSGERRSFALLPANAVTEPASRAAIEISETDDYFELRADLVSARVPKSRLFAPTSEVVGPIAGLGAGARWLGASRLLADGARVEKLETRLIDRGPVFATAELTYHFADGARYTATVRVTAHYSHVEFSESMTGFAAGRSPAVEMAWSGFAPRRRFAANGWKMPDGSLGIDEPVVTDGITEEPHWFPPEVIEDPAREMIYQLSPFQGNQPRNAVPVMSFWEEGSGALELSAFVGDSLAWRHGEYAIWQPTEKLNARFRCANGLLVWTLPLKNGARSIGIALHDVRVGEQTVAAVRNSYLKVMARDRNAFAGQVVYRPDAMQLRYAQLLRSWYGALSLDRVKDWKLDYAADGRAPVTILHEAGSAGDSPEKFEADLFKSALALYPLGLNLGVMNISHRVVPAFLGRYAALREQFSPAQKSRIDALLLLCAYVNAGEELAPVRTALAGTPNMAADGFSIPAEISAVFPDHPSAAQWRDQFEKTVELNAVFYTRPSVTSWKARGGRWAESPATYHWAQLLPITTAQILAAAADGRNRLAGPEMAERAEWLVGQLTAPVFNPDPEWRLGRVARPPGLAESWKPGDAFAASLGFERQIPAHGAHSSGTAVTIPDSVLIWADSLQNYAPLAAEHLRWAHAQARRGDKGEWRGTPLQRAYLAGREPNAGTPPVLNSAKYTGHGIVLRAGVGTPEEVSIHLAQIDQGPNYRWGNSGEGNSGTLYFYGGGKIWSGHESENTGDHTTEDTLGSSTFGVWKNGAYRSIGSNVLDQPLLDLGVAQLATVTARSSQRPYAWPQYRGRSVMLVGTDYFILTDEASGPSRFSWFNAKDLDLPKLIFLEPQAARPDHWFEVSTRMSHGILRDLPRETESSVVLVTHKGNEVDLMDAKARKLAFPERMPMTESSAVRPGTPGVYRVRAPQSRDYVFRAAKRIEFADDGVLFRGTAGVVRRRTGGLTELAMLAGTEIGADSFSIVLPVDAAAAISASISGTENIRGRFDAAQSTTMKVRGLGPGMKFYVDGQLGVMVDRGEFRELTLPAGAHEWELTARSPRPMAPAIRGTVDFSGGADIRFDSVGSAVDYVLEMSRDGGASWTEAAHATQAPARIEGLRNGEKIHVRVRARNAHEQSGPSAAYPIYVSDARPARPDGLRVWLERGAVTLTWGEVLGVAKYNLYRRPQGKSDAWTLIYSGAAREFVDRDQSVEPPDVRPSDRDGIPVAHPIWEYAVTSINGNGESVRSASCDTDPSSWRNWWPRHTPRKPKRVTSYWLPPYVAPDETGPQYYP